MTRRPDNHAASPPVANRRTRYETAIVDRRSGRRAVSDQFTGSSVSSARFETSPDITVNARRTAMHITTLLHERSIALDLDVRTKEEALEALIALLAASSKVTDAEA